MHTLDLNDNYLKVMSSTVVHTVRNTSGNKRKDGIFPPQEDGICYKGSQYLQLLSSSKHIHTDARVCQIHLAD